MLVLQKKYLGAFFSLYFCNTSSKQNKEILTKHFVLN